MASRDHCIYCFDALVSHFDKSAVIPPPTFPNDKYPLFVSWHKESGRDMNLRGCKGTFEAQELHNGLAEFSLISALKDTRFSPVAHHEVSRLECAVSLLCEFEPAKDAYDWEIGKHGIIIDFADPKSGSHRSATYLPEVASEQEWDRDEALMSLIKKAGFKGSVTDDLIHNIKLTRYQSSIHHLPYKEYATHRKEFPLPMRKN